MLLAIIEVSFDILIFYQKT